MISSDKVPPAYHQQRGKSPPHCMHVRPFSAAAMISAPMRSFRSRLLRVADSKQSHFAAIAVQPPGRKRLHHQCVMTLIQKREYLARVVLTPILQVDEESDLCQHFKRTARVYSVRPSARTWRRGRSAHRLQLSPSLRHGRDTHIKWCGRRRPDILGIAKRIEAADYAHRYLFPSRRSKRLLGRRL